MVQPHYTHMIATLQQQVHTAIQDHLVLFITTTEVLQEAVSLADDITHLVVPLPVGNLEEVQHHLVGIHVPEQTLLVTAVLPTSDHVR